MKALSIGLIVLGFIGLAVGGTYGEITTVVIGVLDIEISTTEDIAYDQKKDLMKELQKNAQLTIVDINETCSLSDLTKSRYERAKQYQEMYKLDMILHTNQVGTDYYFSLIDLYKKGVKNVSLHSAGVTPHMRFWRISYKLLTNQDLNRVMRAKKEALGIEEPVVLEEEPTVDLLIEKGPALIAEGRYTEVLDSIQILPAKDRVKVEIRTLECFANLKCWVVHKDPNCKLTWWDQRQKLINWGNNEATPVLINLLQTPDHWLRKYAAELLAYIGDERALDALREAAINDEEFAVRRYAKKAYKVISGEKL
jgi:hypothetical protein